MDKRRTKRKVFNISDEEIKKMYLEGYSLNDIAKVAQDTKGLMALRRKLNDLGVSTVKNMKRYSNKLSQSFRVYPLDEGVFENINTEESAYWLGFLMADGYNHESRTAIALRLSSIDKEHLIKFKGFLNTTLPIHTYIRNNRRYVELNICSIKVSNDLAKLGCVQNKTFTLEFPNIDKSYYSAFIRGYFDGDGCISITPRKDRKSGKVYQFLIVGRLNFLQKIQQYLQGKVLAPISIYKNGNVYVLRCSGRNKVSKILDILYKDASIYLNRKYEIYKSCIPAE